MLSLIVHVLRNGSHSTTETFYEGERPPSEVVDFIRGFRQRSDESDRSEETTDWGQWPAFWATLTVVPGVNVLVALAYLWTRHRSRPLA